MATTPEGRVKKSILKWLDEQGAYYYMPAQNGRGRVGIPDIIACLPRLNGRMVGIEVKAPGKRHNTTPNQDRELKAINKAGGFAIVVDSVEQLKTLEGTS